jgi:hypothetical protein
MTSWTDDEVGGTVWSDDESGAADGSLTGSEVDVDADKVRVIDATDNRPKLVTVEELLMNTESFTQSGTGAIATSVQDRIRRGEYHFMDFIPTSYHSAIRDMSSTQDVSTYIQKAFDAYFADGASLLRATYGLYNIESGITKTGTGRGKITVQGDGRRASIIRAQTAGINMLDMGGGGTSDLASSIELRSMQLDGNELAVRGIKWQYVNFSKMYGVEVFDVLGPGVSLDDVEDSQFYNLDIRKCGHYANALPGMEIEDTSAICNSLDFFALTVERCRYTGLFADRAEALKFIGGKFHGRTTADDTTPDAVDLIDLDRCARVSFAAPQITHPRRYGIRVRRSSGTNDVGITVKGGTFDGAAAYTGTELAYLYLERGFHVIDGNQFHDTLGHASYGSNGHDIRLLSNCLGVDGTNIHYGSPSSKVTNAAGASTVLPVVINSSGYQDTADRIVRSAASDGVTTSYVDGDAAARFQRDADGKLKWGNGTDAVDTTLYRNAANELKTDDKFIAALGYSMPRTSAVSASGAVTYVNGFNYHVLTENVTAITMPSSPDDGDEVVIMFRQAAGGYTVAGWPAAVKLAGAAFTMSATNLYFDVLTFRYQAGLGFWVEQSRTQACR